MAGSLQYTYSRAASYVQKRAQQAMLAERVPPAPKTPSLVGRMTHWMRKAVAQVVGEVSGATERWKEQIGGEVTRYLEDHTRHFLPDPARHTMEDPEELLGHFPEAAHPEVPLLDHLRASVRRICGMDDREPVFDNGETFLRAMEQKRRGQISYYSLHTQEQVFAPVPTTDPVLTAELYGDVVPEASRLVPIATARKQIAMTQSILDLLTEGDPLMKNLRPELISQAMHTFARCEVLLTEHKQGTLHFRTQQGVRLEEDLGLLEEELMHGLHHLYTLSSGMELQVLERAKERLCKATTGEHKEKALLHFPSKFQRRISHLAAWKRRHQALFMDLSGHEAVPVTQTSPGDRPVYLEILWGKLARERSYCVHETRTWILEHMPLFSSSEMEAICELDRELRAIDSHGLLTGRAVPVDTRRQETLSRAYRDSRQLTGIFQQSHDLFGNAHLGDLRQMLATHSQEYMPYLRSTIPHAMKNGGLTTLQKNAALQDMLTTVRTFHDHHGEFLTLHYKEYAPLQLLSSYQQQMLRARKKLHALLESVGSTLSTDVWVYALEAFRNDARWLMTEAPTPRSPLEETALAGVFEIKSIMEAMHRSLGDMREIIRSKRREQAIGLEAYAQPMQSRPWTMQDRLLERDDPTIMQFVEVSLRQWMTGMQTYDMHLDTMSPEEARRASGLSEGMNREKVLRAVAHLTKKYDFRELLTSLLSYMHVNQSKPVLLHALLDMYLYLGEIDLEGFACSSVILRDYIESLRHAPVYGSLIARLHQLEKRVQGELHLSGV